MDFFSNKSIENNAPLSYRMRPNKLDDFIGQEHILGKDSLLRKAITDKRIFSLILHGPPGTGKTSFANVIAQEIEMEYVTFNAVSTGVGEAREAIQKAQQRLALFGKRTLFFLDECHRWNRAQTDVILSAVESGEIIFVGSTTENPYVYMTKALLSRCRVFEFFPLKKEYIIQGLARAIHDPKAGLGMYDITYEKKSLEYIAENCNGDMRVALDELEDVIFSINPTEEGKINLTTSALEKLKKNRRVKLDNTDYYSLLSAFCKSLRGSDPNAALFYANRLISGGCDPLVVARRLVVHASEDVGLAQPNALVISMSALNSIEKIGLPECLLPLSQAIIYVALSPKSNSIATALSAAKEAAEDPKNISIPAYLKNSNSGNKSQKNTYKYPHDYGGWVEQQYLPDELAEKVFYYPSQNGEEKVIMENINNFKRSKKYE